MHYYDIRVKLTEKEWYQLKRMLVETKSKTWAEFIRKIINNSNDVIRVLTFDMPP